MEQRAFENIDERQLTQVVKKMEAIMGTERSIHELSFAEFCLIRELMKIEEQNKRLKTELDYFEAKDRWDAQIRPAEPDHYWTVEEPRLLLA